MRTIAAMLEHIPTHLIGGPLGAGKTSLIRHLLDQKPAGERWAVLINEFGQIGLDAALLTTEADGISLAEIPGGCLCCVNGVPFQVGLARLLRQAKPGRLLIEPSGLGHPAELLRQLRQPPWRNVLSVQPTVLVLDAAALSRGEPLPDSQQQALAQAGLLLMNKSETLDQPSRTRLAEQLSEQPLYWTTQGQLSLEQLPGIGAPCPAGRRRWRRCGSIRASRSAKFRRQQSTGASAGAGTRASVSISASSRNGWRAGPGVAPSWWPTAAATGSQPTHWTVGRWSSGAANGGGIQG